MLSIASIQPSVKLHCKVLENWRHPRKLTYCGVKSIKQKPRSHTDFLRNAYSALSRIERPWQVATPCKFLSQQVSTVLAAPQRRCYLSSFGTLYSLYWHWGWPWLSIFCMSGEHNRFSRYSCRTHYLKKILVSSFLVTGIKEEGAIISYYISEGIVYNYILESPQVLCNRPCVKKFKQGCWEWAGRFSCSHRHQKSPSPRPLAGTIRQGSLRHLSYVLSLWSQDQSLASGHMRNLPLQSPPAVRDATSHQATLQSLRVGVLLAISCDTMHWYI